MRRSVAFLMLSCLVTPPAVAQGAQTSGTAAAPAGPSIVARDTYHLGEMPRLRVTGLTPGETVGAHLFRRILRWQPNGQGGWRPEPVLLHGWGTFRADDDGAVELERAVPQDGTTRGTGPAGLFWSARRQGDPALASVSFAAENVDLPNDDGSHVLRVFRGTRMISERRFRIGVERGDMIRAEINTPELVGFFAAPAGARRLPVIIHLHGSEGGSIAKARADAQRYAEQGFAVLAIAYFAWPYEARGLPLPNAHHNIPIELLDRARRWLAARPEADVRRIGLIGNSKGAEFALVGAATYPWIRAAVACVPSDVVWEGYGSVNWDAPPPRRIPAPGTYSSWSLRGRPLPYIPTYADRRDGFIDNTDRYDRARTEFAAAARAARIPIERSRARLFLIGGDRDRTWSSGAMARSVVNAMDATGRGDRAETFIAPTAGHYLCGDGLYPHRAWQDDQTSSFAPDIDAQGQAEYEAFVRKIAFLREALR